VLLYAPDGELREWIAMGAVKADVISRFKNGLNSFTSSMFVTSH